MANHNHTRVILDFYYRMSGQKAHDLAEIPMDQLSFMSSMDFLDMVRPLALWMLRDGVPLKSVANLYGIEPMALYRWKKQYL